MDNRTRNRSWPRQQHHRLHVPPGHVVLRLLCPGSSIGIVIGTNGAVVTQLRRETGARIHCQNAAAEGSDGVVFVHGPAARDRTLIVDGAPLAVSSAQEAAVRVLERVWGADDNGGDCVCGRLVASESQVRVLVGDGGSNLIRLRKDTSAHITVLRLPNFTPSDDDELIQISGTISDVKKALIAVLSCFHDHPEPLEKATTFPSRHPESLSEIFPNLISLVPQISYDTLNKANGASDTYKKGTWQEVVFRLLWSNEAAGTIIGSKGNVVRILEKNARASIVFSAPSAGFGNRVVTISAFENLDSQHSPAQNAVILIVARVVEGKIEKGSIMNFTQKTSVAVKLLVSLDQVCCLTDKVISEIRQASGTNIHIFGGDSVNQLVQISGEYRAVQDVLFQLTSILRDFLLYREVVNDARPRNFLRWMTEPSSGTRQSLGFFPNSNDESLLTCQINQLEISESDGALSSRSQLPQTPEIGKTNNVGTNGQVGLGLKVKSRNQLAVVTNTIVEIVISEDAFGSIYGEDNGNFNRLREISGAKVEVHDPCPGDGEGKIIISGTPDQTLAAQSLLQAFIQSAKN